MDEGRGGSDEGGRLDSCHCLLRRDAVGHMKEGEEEKTKSYSALIWTHKAIEEQDLEFINDIKVRCGLGVSAQASLKGVCLVPRWYVCVFSVAGPGHRPENPVEGAAPSPPSGPPARYPHYGYAFPRRSPLLPAAAHAGRDVSSVPDGHTPSAPCPSQALARWR